MVEKESNKEREAQQALKARLDTNEELLTYTRVNMTALIARRHYVGLTNKRLILIRIKGGKPSDQVFSIGREFFESLGWTTGLWPRLRIMLPKDKLDLSVSGKVWKKRGKELDILATTASYTPVAESYKVAERGLQQARDFLGLGFPASAQHVLTEALRARPALSMDPSVGSLQTELAERLLALRVGAGFLFAEVGLFLLFGALEGLLGGVEAIGEYLDYDLFIALMFNLWLGFGFWMGRTRWRGLAILRAILGILFIGLSAVPGVAYFDLISQVAWAGSLILVLTGKSRRSRTWIAVGIYIIGYLGIVALAIFLTIASVLLGPL